MSFNFSVLICKAFIKVFLKNLCDILFLGENNLVNDNSKNRNFLNNLVCFSELRAELTLLRHLSTPSCNFLPFFYFLY